MRIVIFSGTTEGRELSEYMTDLKLEHIVCVATESGEAVMESSEYARVCVGRLDDAEMEKLILGEATQLVIDATHPYAQIVTKQLYEICNKNKIKYVRIWRENARQNLNEENTYLYEDVMSCANNLAKLHGNILLSTGSKELSCYTNKKDLRERLYVRVLPTIEAISLCKKANIEEKNIVAMYGPHTQEMNYAVMKQYNIKHLVTKESGVAGGYEEKVSAAKQIGAKLHVIKRPDSAKGVSVDDCKKIIESYVENKVKNKKCALEIYLVGIGMGDAKFLTIEAKRSIEGANYILGAPRMIQSVESDAKKVPIYMPLDIENYLENLLEELGNNKSDKVDLKKKIVVLFSGDTGIYSGASKLYKQLKLWGKYDELKIIPGISSFSAFAAALGTDYSNARLETLHGRTEDKDNTKKIAQYIEDKDRVFILLSGKNDFLILQNLLPKNSGGRCTIDIGYNISYDDQQIIHTDVENLQRDIEHVNEGLFIVLIQTEV